MGNNSPDHDFFTHHLNDEFNHDRSIVFNQDVPDPPQPIPTIRRQQLMLLTPDHKTSFVFRGILYQIFHDKMPRIAFVRRWRQSPQNYLNDILGRAVANTTNSRSKSNATPIIVANRPLGFFN